MVKKNLFGLFVEPLLGEVLIYEILEKEQNSLFTDFSQKKSQIGHKWMLL